MTKHALSKRLDWRTWVTPKGLEDKSVHRWYVFPHSFTDDLVKELIKEWGLDAADMIVDPFAGAGTAVLAAKEKGVPAQGFDLSPLAVLATQVKLANYNAKRLQECWTKLGKTVKVTDANVEHKAYPALVVDSLRGKRLATLHAIRESIESLHASSNEKQFFLLGLLSIVPEFSRAIATGGWLSWRDSFSRPASIPRIFRERIRLMLRDVKTRQTPRQAKWSCTEADARNLPCAPRSASAVICSPPYPNRHDYTRVFGVELMFAFLNWNETRDLRYQLIHSHPEARPKRPNAAGYTEPKFITSAVKRVAKHDHDGKIVRMLHGYFLDVYLCLKELCRILKSGGRAAIVVGNAQYYGTVIAVDRAVASIGEQCGLTCDEIRLVRERGNSAQQMGEYGRIPSRESVVIFTRPQQVRSCRSTKKR